MEGLAGRMCCLQLWQCRRASASYRSSLPAGRCFQCSSCWSAWDRSLTTWQRLFLVWKSCWAQYVCFGLALFLFLFSAGLGLICFAKQPCGDCVLTTRGSLMLCLEASSWYKCKRNEFCGLASARGRRKKKEKKNPTTKKPQETNQPPTKIPQKTTNQPTSQAKKQKWIVWNKICLPVGKIRHIRHDFSGICLVHFGAWMPIWHEIL